jgi:hypothetical protein
MRWRQFEALDARAPTSYLPRLPPESRMEQEPVESQHIFATGCKKIKPAKTRTFRKRNFGGIAKEKFSIDFWLFNG